MRWRVVCARCWYGHEVTHEVTHEGRSVAPIPSDVLHARCPMCGHTEADTVSIESHDD